MHVGADRDIGKMDLVDIDTLLDDLESLEQKNNNSSRDGQPPPRIYTESTSNRPLKVRSVLSSLNDYVDYDRRTLEKSSATGMQCITLGSLRVSD